MKEAVDGLGRIPVHLRRSGEFLDPGIPDSLYRLKVTHQSFSSSRPDSLNIIQDRTHLLFAAQAPVIFYGKTVRLILHS